LRAENLRGRELQLAEERSKVAGDSGRLPDGLLTSSKREPLRASRSGRLSQDRTQTLKAGSVGLGGSTAAVLDRSLRRAGALIDSSVARVGLESGSQVRQLLAGAVVNLLENAFNFTRPSGHVCLTARRNANRKGLGLGLSIRRKSVEAIGGKLGVHDVRLYNRPAQGRRGGRGTRVVGTRHRPESIAQWRSEHAHPSQGEKRSCRKAPR
jgi:hypothetical protein